jgi:hypothetical protein
VVASGFALSRVRPDAPAPSPRRDGTAPLASLAGGTVALVGRVRARRRIASGAPRRVTAALARQNWRMNAAPLALLLPAALLPHAAGCQSLNNLAQSPAAAYVAADRATYDAVAPEYAAYVRADPTLDAESRDRRERTLETWRLRVESGERFGAPAAPAPVKADDVTSGAEPLSSEEALTPKESLSDDETVTGNE